MVDGLLGISYMFIATTTLADEARGRHWTGEGGRIYTVFLMQLAETEEQLPILPDVVVHLIQPCRGREPRAGEMRYGAEVEAPDDDVAGVFEQDQGKEGAKRSEQETTA